MAYMELLAETCQIFRDISQEIQTWVSSQQQVGEESITDWILYKATSRSRRMHHIKFSRTQEAKETGADWEWWILFDQHAWAARIQAKKLKTPAENYKSVTYTNRYGRQIDKLISDANKRNQIPLYAFYTSSISEKPMCAGSYETLHIREGVFLTEADEIVRKHTTSSKTKLLTSENIIQSSNPLSCFLCCSLIRDSVIDYLDQYFHHRQGLQLTIPKIIRDIVGQRIRSETDLRSNEFSDAFFTEFEDTNALLITDLRTNQ